MSALTAPDDTVWHDRAVVDWGAGSYERTTARELEPVSVHVVELARVSAEDSLIDLACGTGNAALEAARRGARVVGVDGAPRLLKVARQRASESGLAITFKLGDLSELPLDDASADVVVSVFGIVFAEDPRRALTEVARVLRPSARLVLSAWVPAGPIDAMLGAVGRIVGSLGHAPPPRRLAWSDPAAVGELATAVGLQLVSTASASLPIRHTSPEAYVDAGREHPMAVAMRPLLQRAGVEEQAREAMVAVLRAANEDPGGFLVHSPYVVHELKPA